MILPLLLHLDDIGIVVVACMRYYSISCYGSLVFAAVYR
jgi:hypothetical protein